METIFSDFLGETLLRIESFLRMGFYYSQPANL